MRFGHPVVFHESSDIVDQRVINILNHGAIEFGTG